mgnify:CR=1 FL=1
MYATGRQRSCQEPDLLGTELPIPPMRLSVRHLVHTALSNQTAAHSANLYTDAGHELSETEYLRLLPPKRARVIGRHWAKVNQKGRQCKPFRDALPVFFAFGLGEIVQRPLLFENPIYNHITVLYWLYRQKDFIPVKAVLKPA